MRAAVPEALGIGVPGGDPAACLARLRHHWALDTWRSSPSTSEDTLRTQMYQPEPEPEPEPAPAPAPSPSPAPAP